MKRLVIFLSVIGIGFILSCEKNITVKMPAYNNKVIIQGFIEPDSVPIVYLNKTVPYFDKAVKKDQLMIRNALITIRSNISSDELTLDSAFDKINCQYDYFYKGRLKILPDTKYDLTIISGGKTYTASATTNLLAPRIDSVSYVSNFNDLYGEHEGIVTYFKDVPNQVSRYRYEMVRLIDTSIMKADAKIQRACLGKDITTVAEIGRAVFDDAGKEGKQITIVAEPAYPHKKGTKGQIFIQSMDKNAYEFFSQLDRQKLAELNPFIEPVFLLEGQFGKQAVGFFSAKKNSNPVMFTFPE